MIKKAIISVSVDSALIARIARSQKNASAVVTKALNLFFHLDDENLDALTSEELAQEYETARLRSAAIDLILTERKQKTEEETRRQIEELKQREAEQAARIDARRKEAEARGGGGMRA